MRLTTALLVAAFAYVLRGFTRGFDFTPDLPLDAVILAMLVIVLVMVAWIRRADQAEVSTEAGPSDHLEDVEETDG